MTLRIAILTAIVMGLANAPANAVTIGELHEKTAGNDLSKLEKQVSQLAALARTEIDATGIEAVRGDFRKAPWRRGANGLHLWGVTTDGVAWFDAGHPELEGLNVSEMSDQHGRNWADLAIASADGTGEAIFELTFPHPVQKHAARGLHKCFRIADSDRVLCAGAFLDGE